MCGSIPGHRSNALVASPSSPRSAYAPSGSSFQVGLTPAWALTLIRRWYAEGPDGQADRGPATNGNKAKQELEREVSAWEEERNERQVGVEWRFTTADARIDSRHHYPPIPTG